MVVILSSADWKPAAGQNENSIHVKNRETMPERGWDSVTVPGAVGGWVALSDRFGKLPFAKLFEPAIALAKTGFVLSPVIAKLWAAGRTSCRISPVSPNISCQAAECRLPANASEIPISPQACLQSPRPKATRSTAAHWPSGSPRTPPGTARHSDAVLFMLLALAGRHVGEDEGD